MRRRTFLATASATALGSVAVGSVTASRRLDNPSFESGLDGWEVRADVPGVPWDVSSSAEHASDGRRSVSLWIDGIKDDGTVWVQQPVDFSEVNRLSLDTFNPQKSPANTIYQVAVYAGPEKRLSERDFNVDNVFDDHEGWRRFEYPVEYDGEGLVAVGANIIWEARDGVRWIDNVELHSGPGIH